MSTRSRRYRVADTGRKATSRRGESLLFKLSLLYRGLNARCLRTEESFRSCVSILRDRATKKYVSAFRDFSTGKKEDQKKKIGTI